ncbi:MAG: hypothetical protein V1777_00515 [Candidatus Micrarchaeota archaeon]
MVYGKMDDVEKLVNPQAVLEAALEAELGRVGNQSVSLVVMEGAHYLGASAAILKSFENAKRQGIIVSVNKPVSDLREFLSKREISFDGFFFVDCITETSDRHGDSAKNVKYLESPKNLLEISVEMEKLLRSGQNAPPFVLVDSLSTFLLYNKPEVLERFVHNLSSKMHEHKNQGVFLMIRTRENEDFIEIVSQFCDNVIEVSEKNIKTR